jgi:hypothetical protein
VPDLILIEGKLVNLPYFLDEVKESVDQHIHPLFRGSFQIQPSQLGVNAPLIGAAAFLLKDVYFNPLKVFTAQLGAVNS